MYLKKGTYSAVSKSDSLITDTTSTSASTSALNIGEKGTFGVLAYNASGNSGWSNIEVVQPLPRKPTISTPIDVSQPGKASFTWNNNNGVDTFNIYRVLTSTSLDPEIDGTLIATVGGSVTTYSDNGFPTYNVSYTYAVIGKNASGSSKVPNKPTATPLEPAWETIVYEPFDSEGMHVYNSKIAGNDKGEAFVLAKLTDWTTQNFRLLKYNEVFFNSIG